jgi:hypothetical protein
VGGNKQMKITVTRLMDDLYLKKEIREKLDKTCGRSLNDIYVNKKI